MLRPATQIGSHIMNQTRQQRAEAAKSMKAGGMSVKEIASFMCLQPETVYNYLADRDSNGESRATREKLHEAN